MYEKLQLPKMRSVANSSARKSNGSMKQMFEVLFIGANPLQPCPGP